MRFSRYLEHPEDYGLTLIPDLLYSCCFKDQPQIVENAGIYYNLVGGSFRENAGSNFDLYQQISGAVAWWRQQFYSDKPPALIMNDIFFSIILMDTRPCAQERSITLMGLSAQIYRLAWEPVSLNSLTEKIPGYTEEKIKKTLDSLVSRKLMLSLSGKYLALAVPSQEI